MPLSNPASTRNVWPLLRPSVLSHSPDMPSRTPPASALLLLTLMSFGAEAQSRPFLPIVLRVPASTRMLALGDAGVAGRDDDVVFYDPAQVAVARGTSVSG